jgi:hypothetical protein
LKTEILYQYPLEDEYLIERVLPFPGGKCVVLRWKYPNTVKIDLISLKDGAFAVSEIVAFEEFKSEYHLFRTSNGFGLMIETNEMLLWKDLDSKPETIRIANPFRGDKFGRKYRVNLSSFDEGTNTFYFGFEPRTSHGFPARYWAKLNLKKRSLLGISLSEQWKWSTEKELDLNNYPKTKFAFSETEFLSIKELMVKSDLLYVHTIGGTTTRLKSGSSYEFSIISKLSTDGTFIQNFPIEEGTGNFSTSKEYFILHNRSNKKRLTFYKTDDYSVAFEVSLTPKQNLAEGKSTFLLCDIFENQLYFYNARLFTICKFSE